MTLTVYSATYARGWGKLAGTHRTWSARVVVGIIANERVYVVQHECPIQAAADALSLARRREECGAESGELMPDFCLG